MFDLEIAYRIYTIIPRKGKKFSGNRKPSPKKEEGSKRDYFFMTLEILSESQCPVVVLLGEPELSCRAVVPQEGQEQSCPVVVPQEEPEQNCQDAVPLATLGRCYQT